MSRSDTSLLKLKIVCLIGLLYLYQNICGSEFWKYSGIDEVTPPILKNTRQIYKIHSFINERDFDKMSLLINLGIDKWTESLLSITSSQKCSLIHLVIPIIKLISLNIQNGMGREQRKESIAC